MVNYALTLEQWRRFFNDIAHPNYSWYNFLHGNLGTNSARMVFNLQSQKIKFNVRRSGSQAYSTKTGYIALAMSGVDNYQYTAPANEPRYDNLSFTNLAKDSDGTQGDLFGAGTWLNSFVIVPNLPQYTSTKFRTYAQNIFNGVKNEPIFGYKRPPIDTIHLNDFSESKIAY